MIYYKKLVFIIVLVLLTISVTGLDELDKRYEYIPKKSIMTNFSFTVETELRKQNYQGFASELITYIDFIPNNIVNRHMLETSSNTIIDKVNNSIKCVFPNPFDNSSLNQINLECSFDAKLNSDFQFYKVSDRIFITKESENLINDTRIIELANKLMLNNNLYRQSLLFFQSSYPNHISLFQEIHLQYLLLKCVDNLWIFCILYSVPLP